MVTLSLVHYIFIIMTVIILGFLIFKKEIVIPCIMGILLIGLAYTGNVVTSVQILNSAIITSSSESGSLGNRLFMLRPHFSTFVAIIVSLYSWKKILSSK